MLLSSLNRLKLLNNIPKTKDDLDISLATSLQGVSQRIEDYCKRGFKKASHQHIFSPKTSQRTVRLPNYPIESITEISTDSTGQFSGNESIVNSSSYQISADGRDVIFNVGIDQTTTGIYLIPTKVRILYVGGISAHATISVLRIDDVTGTPHVGDTFLGSDSGAFGTVVRMVEDVVVDDEIVDQMYVEVTTGAFEDGESFTAGPCAGTILSHDRTAIVESDPALIQACEIQTWYIHKNKNNLENATFEQDTVSRKSPGADLALDYNFLPDVRGALEKYRNKLIDYKDVR